MCTHNKCANKKMLKTIETYLYITLLTYFFKRALPNYIIHPNKKKLFHTLKKNGSHCKMPIPYVFSPPINPNFETQY